MNQLLCLKGEQLGKGLPIGRFLALVRAIFDTVLRTFSMSTSARDHVIGQSMSIILTSLLPHILQTYPSGNLSPWGQSSNQCYKRLSKYESREEKAETRKARPSNPLLECHICDRHTCLEAVRLWRREGEIRHAICNLAIRRPHLSSLVSDQHSGK